LVSVQDARSSRVGDVITGITRHMRKHQLMPGEKLPSESLLAKELNVSRATVREAFQSLATMRIIELATGKRATVAQIDHGALSLMIEHGVHTHQLNIQHIYDVRRTIETRIVTLASIRRTDAETKEILSLAEEMQTNAGNPAVLMEKDLGFHMALARASGNPVYLLLVGAFQGITRQTWPIGWKSRITQSSRDLMVKTHMEIARAVAAGNPQAAVEFMAQHFDESVRALLAAGMS
jgi:GntR family transcriptional regulator, transcriptional repressor for pyruvate dehydrogenase complex